ncbi:MAG: hypothetical protein PHU25_18195 [Deltaproteobacteria bacterium]|nr:hypothetical protein [Deltaproteobacteria bacterium]
MSALAGLVALFLPLLSTLGYELSLLTALVASLGAGHLAALSPGRARDSESPFPGATRPVLVMFLRGLPASLALLAPPLVFTLLRGLRVPQCNMAEGLAFYALVPLPAVLAAQAAGLFIGLLMPGRRSASVLWFLAWAASLALAVREFHDTPAVFAYGPFFGYFPGVLYDEMVAVGRGLMLYRLVTFVQIAAALTLAEWLVDPSSLKLLARFPSLRLKALAAPLLLAATVVALHIAAPALGLAATREGLERLLSRRVTMGRLDLFFPPATRPETVKALADDAAFDLQRVESFLEAPGDRRYAVFFFADAREKAAAMGAAGTNVAKPWRGEAYVTVDETPHPVLRHELAHAVSARWGRGPFMLPGRANGWLPDPGLLEGLAVAAGGPKGDLTVHQWAAAMNRLGLLPRAEKLFGLGFLDLPASTAYTAAGSFCLWVRDTHGARALVDAYSGKGWSAATGEALPALARKWEAFLGSVRLEDPDLAAARHRFDRPAIIRAACVHEVARLEAEATALAAHGDYRAALAVRERACARSGDGLAARLTVFNAAVVAGDLGKARAVAKRVVSDKAADPVSRDEVAEVLADLDLAAAAGSRADAIYLDLAARAPSDDERRRLEVKARLASMPVAIRTGFTGILFRAPGRPPLPEPLAMLRIAQAARTAPDDPILAYVLARAHFRLGDFDGAVRGIYEAEGLGLSQTAASIWNEARRLRAEALFSLGRYGEAEAAFARLASDASLRDGARALAADWVERCRFQASHKTP